ncbi:DUF916 and DUF3324 domain-containing protein [Enterococcus caccae]|uniref:Uncharacterized protein n=1 Tax=Enterococcus caccae ATCC BAA-1240 TaxID=1158612 RepID=R3X701_9ENTE|nr:DUF916 and DUF3324 domain-containing protein [Enterococcus caccae]EOL49880.1 hypothetical protein UC7_00545 [Enterococcus caccae ATCC BAA-1240]EOT56220.1 hypothetical protein I580_03020 [Enterococcus caccae ATCC BAA-1240]OJG25497.1 hypothetical protein RU98_GL001042 [Enterococcus caccae]
MNKYLSYLALVLGLLVFFVKPVKSLANQDSSNLINGLSYELLYPENQTNKNLGYFDLTVQSENKQTVSLKLYNSLDKELTVQVNLNTAKTNNIGRVEYGLNNLKKDPSLKHGFTALVKGPEQVVIPPKSSQRLELAISLPKNVADGLIAGGIQLQPIDTDEINSRGKKDIVVNEFAFLIGMLLRVGDTSHIKPELKLNKTYIAFKDKKSHFFVNMSNVQPVYLEMMAIEVQIRKANKSNTLFEYYKKDMRMAPNSMIDFPVDLADKGLNAGKYTAQINVSSKNGGNWSWTEDFSINTLEAERIHSQQVENKPTHRKKIWLFAPVLIIVVASNRLIKRKRAGKRKK